jgi:hypothetical protein
VAKITNIQKPSFTFSCENLFYLRSYFVFYWHSLQCDRFKGLSLPNNIKIFKFALHCLTGTSNNHALKLAVVAA